MGIDLVELARFRRLVEQADDAQLLEIFTAEEYRVTRERSHSIGALAARFAVKEAVMKAIGGVDAFALDWRNIETVTAPDQRPEVRLHGPFAAWAMELGIRDITISISHTRHFAVGLALATQHRASPIMNPP